MPCDYESRRDYGQPASAAPSGVAAAGGLLIGGAALGALLAEVAYRLGGGIFLWFLVGFVVPLAVVVNRYGAIRGPRAQRGTWRSVMPGRRDG